MTGSGIATQLPLLLQTISSQLAGREPLAATASFFNNLESVIGAANPSPAEQEVFFHLGHGFLQGLQGKRSDAYEYIPPSKEAELTEAEKLLNNMRSWPACRFPKMSSVSPETRRALNEARAGCAAAFISGFLSAFPDASEKPFVNHLAGRWSAQKFRLKRDLPLSEGVLDLAQAVGRQSGERLKHEYAMGLLEKIDATLMDRLLTANGVTHYLGLSGWILGVAEFLKADFPEASELLVEKRDWMVGVNYRRGYFSPRPDSVVGEVRRLYAYSDQALLRLETTDPRTAASVRKSLKAAIWRTASKFRDEIPKALKKLPSLENYLEERMAELRVSDPRTAEMMDRYRDEIVRRAEFSTKFFDYLDETIRSLPQQMEAWENILQRFRSSHPDAAEALLENEDTIFNKIIQGDFALLDETFQNDLLSVIDSLDKAFQKLTQANPEIADVPQFRRPQLLKYVLRFPRGLTEAAGRAVDRITSCWQDLEQAIEQLERLNPELARKLQSKHAAVLSFSLSKGRLEEQGPKKFVECLRIWPELIDLIPDLPPSSTSSTAS